MRLLTFGASGQTEALRAKPQKTGTQSPPSCVSLPSLEGVGRLRPIVRGTVADSGAVAAAVPGHDAVVSTLGVGAPLKHDPDVVAGGNLHSVQCRRMERAG